MMSIFRKKIVFSDEALIHLGGYINKYNLTNWGSVNLHEVLGKLMYPMRVSATSRLWSGDIIGPYFLENQDDATVITT